MLTATRENSAIRRRSAAIGLHALAVALLCTLTSCRPTDSPPSPTAAAVPLQTALESSPPLTEDERPSTALPEEAAAIVDRLTKEFPGNVEALFARGRLADLFGRSREAVRCWEECLSLDPQFALAQEQIALVDMDRGDFEKAAERLQQALDRQPALPEARLHLGKALLSLGRYEDAVSVLERQAADQPGASEVWFRLGQAKLQVQDSARALECYEKAVEIDPESPVAWYGMAQACERLGDGQRARDCRNRFEALDRQRHDADRKKRGGSDHYDEQLLGFAHNIAGDFFNTQRLAAEAQGHWRQAAGHDPKNAFCRRSLGESLAQENRFAEALVVLEELQRLQPENIDNLFSLAALHKQLRQPEALEKCLQRVLALAPENAQAASGLAQFYLSTGQRLPEARRLAQQAVKSQPTGESYFVLSALCLATQDRPGAIAALREALRLDPRNPKYLEAASVLSQE